MSNMQFYLALGVPFFSLLVVYFTSVLSNRAAINDLRAEMHKGFADLRSDFAARIDGLRSETGARIDGLRSEMGSRTDDMRSEMGSRIDDLRTDIGARLDRIEKKQDALDSEIRIGHDHRIAVLEARVLHQAS